MSSRLKAIIVVMSLALLGLVLIQFYWIDNAIVLKKDEFNQKVVHAMRKVIHDMERREAIENLQRHRQGRRLIHQQMMKRKRHLMNQARVQRNEDRVRQRVETDKNGNTLRITERRSGDSTTRIITKEISGNINRSSVQIDVNFGNDAGQWQIGSDSNVMDQKIQQRSNFIDDIIVDLMDDDDYKSMEERIDFNLLDSMIRGELSEVMINTEVEFGVFDYFGRLITEAEGEDQAESLMKSIYKARLFPNDIFGEPYFISLNFPNQKGFLLKSMWITLSVSTMFLLLIVAAFGYTIHIIQNQKQLSIIKNDFISNMTHELKTPISTISLACEALSDDDLIKDKEKKGKFLQMISQENKRLGMLVEDVLKSSIWDKSDFKLKLRTLDMHEIIKEMVEVTSILLDQKDGKMELNLKAEVSEIQGDKVHLTNIINNLIDNAIKYCIEKPSLVISTYNKDENIVLEISDNGPGIPKDQQKKIFDKFYRIPTGNIHNVKGFGLGLNYVKNVVVNHGGNIEVKSAENKGTTFTINLPFNFHG